MASVRKGRGNSWEIRESTRTSKGPRSRTLATFRQLDDEVIARASSRASAPLEAGELIAAARRAGAPVAGTPADEAAKGLIRELSHGGEPRPALRRLLQMRLEKGVHPPDDIGSATEWLGESLEQRGETLRDLLALTDSLPKRRRGKLRYPRLTTR